MSIPLSVFRSDVCVFGVAVELSPRMDLHSGWRESVRGGLPPPEDQPSRRRRRGRPAATVFGVNPAARVAAHVGSAESAHGDALRALRWTRPLALLLIGFVVTTAFQTHPAPGAHGEHLGVTIALIGIAVGTIGRFRLTDATPTVHSLLLVLIVLGSATLVSLQPNGPGFLGVFPAVSAAALTLPVRRSAVVAGIALGTLAVAWAIGGDRGIRESSPTNSE